MPIITKTEWIEHYPRIAYTPFTRIEDESNLQNMQEVIDEMVRHIKKYYEDIRVGNEKDNSPLDSWVVSVLELQRITSRRNRQFFFLEYLKTFPKDNYKEYASDGDAPAKGSFETRSIPPEPLRDVILLKRAFTLSGLSLSLDKAGTIIRFIAPDMPDNIFMQEVPYYVIEHTGDKKMAPANILLAIEIIENDGERFSYIVDKRATDRGDYTVRKGTKVLPGPTGESIEYEGIYYSAFEGKEKFIRVAPSLNNLVIKDIPQPQCNAVSIPDAQVRKDKYTPNLLLVNMRGPFTLNKCNQEEYRVEIGRSLPFDLMFKVEHEGIGVDDSIFEDVSEKWLTIKKGETVSDGFYRKIVAESINKDGYFVEKITEVKPLKPYLSIVLTNGRINTSVSDEGCKVFAFVTPAVHEGEKITISISPTNLSCIAPDSRIKVTVRNGTAKVGEDYSEEFDSHDRGLTYEGSIEENIVLSFDAIKDSVSEDVENLFIDVETTNCKIGESNKQTFEVKIYDEGVDIPDDLNYDCGVTIDIPKIITPQGTASHIVTGKLKLPAPATQDSCYTIKSDDGSAKAGENYKILTPMPITIKKGDTEASFQIEGIPDTNRDSFSGSFSLTVVNAERCSSDKKCKIMTPSTSITVFQPPVVQQGRNIVVGDVDIEPYDIKELKTIGHQAIECDDKSDVHSGIDGRVYENISDLSSIDPDTGSQKEGVVPGAITMSLTMTAYRAIEREEKDIATQRPTYRLETLNISVCAVLGSVDGIQDENGDILAQGFPKEKIPKDGEPVVYIGPKQEFVSITRHIRGEDFSIYEIDIANIVSQYVVKHSDDEEDKIEYFTDADSVRILQNELSAEKQIKKNEVVVGDIGTPGAITHYKHVGLNPKWPVVATYGGSESIANIEGSHIISTGSGLIPAVYKIGQEDYRKYILKGLKEPLTLFLTNKMMVFVVKDINAPLSQNRKIQFLWQNYEKFNAGEQ